MVSEYTYDPRDDFFIERIDRDTGFDMPSFHIHHKFEIYYEIAGTRRYFIEDSAYIVNAGSVVLIGENQIHKTASLGDAPSSRVVLNFSREYLEKIAAAFAEVDFFSFLTEEHNHLLSNITVKQQNHIQSMLQQLLLLEGDPSQEREAMRKMMLATLLLELKDLCRQQREQGGERGRVSNHIVDQIQAYISQHYAEKLTLTGIADFDRHCKPVLHQPVLPQPAVQKIDQPQPDRIHQRRARQRGAEPHRKIGREHLRHCRKNRLYDDGAFPPRVQGRDRPFAPAVPPVLQAQQITAAARTFAKVRAAFCCGAGVSPCRGVLKRRGTRGTSTGGTGSGIRRCPRCRWRPARPQTHTRR